MSNSDADWKVQFVGSARDDLIEIIRYILENDGLESAKEMMALIRQDVKQRLKTLPHRGRLVPELETISREYREIRVKPYRIIYRAIDEQKTVRILVVAHVKRSIHDMLLNRLIFTSL